ncbi:porin [Mesorhizobium sp. VK9D]|uniref:porin n=1 Tax=Mesorhizobium australafricanum TaxID=3072311 RepID=UPI002A24B3CB|nr:porin [Mesorhizobium sp. VK9D]MDX8456582.1 porin [Mesorhizobium sp. VK9D]
MNIKSLLLGSAAALIAVSGARAADAVVVAEPEPAEYVKICDVYGAGYFYIPGTETCLRIGGYVRYDIGVGEFGSVNGTEGPDRLDGSRQQTYRKNARADVKIFTGSETELGSLKTYSEFEFNFGNSQGNPFARQKGGQLDSAWISLGGFLIGYTDSVFASWTGFAGNVINDSVIAYGAQDGTNQINYTFDAGNGFSAVLSLEEGRGSYSQYRAPGQDWVVDDNTVDSYVPHVVGGVKYTQGWGSISGVAAYNSDYEEWSGKVRLDVKATSELSLFAMAGYGTDDHIDRNFYKPWGGNWAVWGGASYKLNEKTSINGQVSYDEDKNLVIAANVNYEIVPGFKVIPEVDYNRAANYDRVGNHTNNDSFVSGVVRFQRSF